MTIFPNTLMKHHNEEDTSKHSNTWISLKNQTRIFTSCHSCTRLSIGWSWAQHFATDSHSQSAYSITLVPFLSSVTERETKQNKSVKEMESQPLPQLKGLSYTWLWIANCSSDVYSWQAVAAATTKHQFVKRYRAPPVKREQLPTTLETKCQEFKECDDMTWVRTDSDMRRNRPRLPQDAYQNV